jgi:hypothetical protein
VTYISIIDLLLVPIYLTVIYYIAFIIRDKYYPKGNALRIYFMPGLTVKLIGAILICLVYIFYFGYGDTLTYFNTSKIINSSWADDAMTWLRLVTHTANYDNVKDGYYLSLMDDYNQIPNYIVSATGACIGMVCFNRLLCVAIIIAAIAYSGLWALFRTFTKLYPQLIKESALAALFVPSVAIWGSGLFKDTICMFALGWLIFYFFKLIKSAKFSLLPVIAILISIVIIYSVKPYIIAIILPVLFIRLIIGLFRSMRGAFKKLILSIVIFTVTIIGGKMLISRFTENITEILLQNLTETITGFSNATQKISEDENGSGYNLGELDGSVGDLVKKIPSAINVTFFRPYLWEANKSMTLLAALESSALLLFSLYLILKVNFKIFRYLWKDPNLLTFLLFSLIFAYLVGITTSNFGTLSRFKIPCIPFFVMTLFIINHYYVINKKKTEKMPNITH